MSTTHATGEKDTGTTDASEESGGEAHQESDRMNDGRRCYSTDGRGHGTNRGRSMNSESGVNSRHDKSAGTTERTDPRGRNGPLGIDSDGFHHVYQTPIEAILVIDPDEGEIVHREQLPEQLAEIGHTIDVDGWMATIEEEYGWAERRYGRSLGDMAAEVFESHLDASEEADR